MESAALERIGAAVEAIQRTAKTLLVAAMRPIQPIELEHHHHLMDRLLFTFFLPPQWALARALVPLGRLLFLQPLLVLTLHHPPSMQQQQLTRPLLRLPQRYSSLNASSQAWPLCSQARRPPP